MWQLHKVWSCKQKKSTPLESLLKRMEFCTFLINKQKCNSSTTFFPLLNQNIPKPLNIDSATWVKEILQSISSQAFSS